MQYGGFAIDPILLVKAKSFVSLLAEKGKPINTKIFYSAGYGKHDCRLSCGHHGRCMLVDSPSNQIGLLRLTWINFVSRSALPPYWQVGNLTLC